jgi:hypothetical protein
MWFTAGHEIGALSASRVIIAVAPAIGSLSISPTTLRPAASGLSVLAASTFSTTGAVVTYTDDARAHTTFTVQRALGGRRIGRSCMLSRARAPARSRCTVYRAVGRFTHDDVPAANRFRFTGCINGRRLGLGRYRLQALPRNAAGSGPPAYVSFRVTAR